MTLKGKEKILRNIIVCFVAVIFMVGVASVVYSKNNASVKVEFKGDTWNTDEEFKQKQWLMNANENEVKFIVDLSDYGIESTVAEDDGEIDTVAPVEPEQPEVQEPEQPENPGDGEIENPPVEGSEEGNETADSVEVVSEGENIQTDEAPVEDNEDVNGDDNTPENSETTGKVEIKYPELAEVMDINLTTDNKTIVFGNLEISKQLEKEVVDGVEAEVFKGKYEVTIPLNKQDDIDDSFLVDTDYGVDDSFLVDTDYNIYVELVVKENTFGIPVTTSENLSKKFTIVKDVTTPRITANLIDNEIITLDKKIEFNFSEEVNFDFEVYSCEDDNSKIDSIANQFGNKYEYSLSQKDFKDGDYKVIVNVSDKAGNINSKEIPFTINKSAPIVTIDGKDIKDFYNKDDKLVVKLEASDNNKIDFEKSQFKLVKPGQKPEEVEFEKFDGEGDNVKVATKEIDLSEDGIYLLTVEAYDNKGQGGFIFTNKEIIVDRSLAEININVKNNDFYNKDKKLEVTIKDENLGNDTIEVFLNENKTTTSWNNSSIEGGIVYDSNFSEPGNYIIVVNSTDAANNKSEEKKVSFTIDKKDPTISILDSNNIEFESGQHLNVEKLDLKVLINDLNHSTNKITVTGILNGNGVLVNDKGEKVSQLVYENLEEEGNDRFKNLEFTEEGQYSILVESTDLAGNGLKKEITFVIDRTAPVVDITLNKEAENPGYLNNFFKEAPDATIKITEDNYKDYKIEKLTLTHDSEEAKTLIFSEVDNREMSSTYLAKDYFTEDGTYTLDIEVKDAAGHIAKESVTFVVDTEIKEVIIDHYGEKYGENDNNQYYIGNEDSKTVSLIIEEPNIEPNENTDEDLNKENSSETNIVEIKVNGIVDKEWTKSNESPLTYTKDFSEDGVYKIQSKVIDKAGNISESEVTIVVDNDTPAVNVYMDDINIQSKMEHFFGIKDEKKLSIKITDTNLAKDGILDDEYSIKVIKDGTEINDIKLEEVKNTLATEREFTSTYFITDEDTTKASELDGEYEVVVIAKDKAKNVYNQEAVTVAKFTIDNTRAEVSFEGVKEGDYFGIIENNENLQKKNNITIVVKDKNTTKNNDVTIEINNKKYLLEGNNTVSEIINDEKYPLEEVIAWDYTTPGVAKLPIALIEDGNYKITVNSTDKAENEVIENNIINFTIDNHTPVVNITANAVDNNSQDENKAVEISNKDGVTTNDGKHINTDKVEFNIEITDVNLLKSIEENSENHSITLSRVVKSDKNKNNTINYSLKEDNRVSVDEKNGKIIIKDYVEEDGDYTITVNSTDLAGNKKELQLSFTIDTTRPIVEISNYSELNDKFLGEDKVVGITITEENPRIDKEEEAIQITSQRFKPEGGIAEDSVPEKTKINEKNTFNIGADGKYVYNVVGKDKAGNPVELVVGDTKYDTAQLTFAIDKTIPTIKIEGLDRENNHYNSERNLTIKVTDDNQSSNEVTLYKSSVEGKEFVQIDTKDFAKNTVEITQPTLGNYGTTAKTTEYNYKFEANQLKDGCYKIKIKSTDIVGKIETKEWIFTIDSKAPVISFNDFKALDGSFRQSFDKVTVNIEETNIAHDDTNMTVSYVKTTPDGVTSDPIIFRQRTNSASYSKDNEGNSLFADADAIYTFTVSGTDAATNESIAKTEKTISFTKDATKPVVSITGVEEGEHYNTDKTVKILSNDVNHKINTVTVTKDGQAYSVGEFAINGRDAVINHTFSQEGDYVITLYSKDKAGNENTTSKKFTIDKTAPVITPVFKGENRVIKSGEYINKIFTPEFKLDKAEDKFDFINLNETQNVTAGVPMSSTEMVYHYTGQASDKAGNITKMDITFTVDVTNPQVKVTGIIDGFFSEDMKPEYEITDTNLDNANTLVTLNGKEFKSGTKIKDQDYYNLKLLGTDLATNATARNIVFAIDKDKPVIKFVEAMSGKYFTEDFIPDFIIEDLTDYTIISMTLDGVDYEVGDPVTEEGKHVLYIEVKDKAENVESISVEFILDKTPPKFIVNGIEDKGVYVEPVTAEITLENPLDKITGITVNGELAQGDVNEENGQQVIKLNFTDINDYEVVLKAVDEAGNETEEVINFKIAKKNIFTTIYANKKIFYPVVISLIIIASISGITALRMSKKEQAQDDNSEE